MDDIAIVKQAIEKAFGGWVEYKGYKYRVIQYPHRKDFIVHTAIEGRFSIHGDLKQPTGEKAAELGRWIIDNHNRRGWGVEAFKLFPPTQTIDDISRKDKP